MLLHGGPGTGKTHLIGDALYAEQERGKVAYVNIAGQDGWLSLAEYEYADIHAETVETMSDFRACMSDLKAMGLAALGVDSIRDLLRLCTINTTGAERPPKVGTKDNEYSAIYFDFELCLREMRESACRVLTCSTSDRSTDQLSGVVNIVPDLPGRQGNGVAALFDFVGYMHASTKLGKTRRALTFQPMTISANRDTEISILTRQRLARAITEDIVLPDGKGAWPLILDVFNEHLQLKAGEEAPKRKWSKG